MKRTTAGQIRPKTTRETYVTLPIQLRNDIQQLPLSKTQISHCYKFVGILYRDSIAEHLHADLIGMSTHGRRGLSHFFNGSISEDLVNHALRPVITFKI